MLRGQHFGRWRLALSISSAIVLGATGYFVSHAGTNLPRLQTTSNLKPAETMPPPQLMPPPPPPTPAAKTMVKPTAANPLTGLKLYVDPDTPAARQVASWRGSRPGDAAQMAKIASRPTARWLGDWTDQPQTDSNQFVTAAANAGAMLFLAIYNIPLRDCGEYSAGGAGSAQAYREWIRAVAAGIGSRRVIIVLEPDALAGLDCLSTAQKAERIDLIRDAVNVLKANPLAAVYLDAGNAKWQPVGQMAGLLNQAGVASADGFALNVSNFLTTAESQSYGDQLSAQVGGKHYVIDTSRNGLGPMPDYSWCNPPGRALGQPPTLNTGHTLADAYLWVKYPGESDGDCNGAPESGTWWPDYALGLAQRS